MSREQRGAQWQTTDALILREWKQTDQCVDHHVSHQRIREASIPSAWKLLSASAEGVNQTSASWSLRSRLISAGMLRSREPETGLHVGHADPKLRTNQPGSQCGVQVSAGDSPVRLTIHALRFQSSDDLGSLAGVASRANLQGWRPARACQVGERKHRTWPNRSAGRRESGLVYAWFCRERPEQRRCLHEVRPRSNHLENTHSWFGCSRAKTLSPIKSSPQLQQGRPSGRILESFRQRDQRSCRLRLPGQPGTQK